MNSSAANEAKTPGLLPRTIATVIRWALQLRLVRAFLLYSERKGAQLADSVTYRALFSVFAAVLLGFSAAGIWLNGNPEAMQGIINAVDSAIPGLVGDGGIIKDPTAVTAIDGLSVAGIISLVGLIGAGLGAIGSLRNAVRVIAGTVADDVAPVFVILRNLALAVGIALSFVVSAFLTFAVQLSVGWIADLLGIAEDSTPLRWSVRALSLLLVLALNGALIFGVFRVLSGVKARGRALWPGVIIGAVGLLVLQELSGLFVGGASSNPLLATFASLLALLIWMNFSAQVILISCAYIVTASEEESDRVSARFGASTFAQRRVRRAEQDVVIATQALRLAQDMEAKERESVATKA